MASDTVQQIKDKLSIVEIVGQYARLERAGVNFKGRCPLHNEKTPSFIVSPDRGSFHCFGCGAGGDLFTFIQLIEGTDFKGALRILGDKAGIEIREYHGSDAQEKNTNDRLYQLLETATLWYIQQLSSDAREYLQSRKIEDTTINSFRIGEASNQWSACSDYLIKKEFIPQEIIDAGMAKRNERGTLIDKFRNRIMFPLFDSAGRVIGFSGRIFGPHASPDAPKYLNTPETALFHKSRMLYGYNFAKQAMRKLDCAILVEGQVDLVLSHQVGWTNTVAVSGTAFTREHAELIRRMTNNLLLALDGDSAGLKAAARTARVALRHGMNVKVITLPEDSDPADLIRTRGADAWKECIRNAKDIIEFLLNVLTTRAKDRDALRRSVEAAILPFLVDVQSPIAREQYSTLIAQHLGVSQGAILDAIARIPAEPPSNDSTYIEQHSTSSNSYDRRELARGVLALVASGSRELPYSFDHTPLLAALNMSTLDDLQPLVNDKILFIAEEFVARPTVTHDIKELARTIELGHLRKELDEVTFLLQKAEHTGDDEKIIELLSTSKLLTSRIANLQKIG